MPHGLSNGPFMKVMLTKRDQMMKQIIIQIDKTIKTVKSDSKWQSMLSYTKSATMK